jgi:hypothetical protein
MGNVGGQLVRGVLVARCFLENQFMPATIDYTTEATLSDIFTTDNFTDELHKYLGLDPAVSAADQPVDVDELLTSVLHIVEQDQWRIILEKTVTLRLPYNALCARDNKVYLPYGSVAAITTFAYEDSDDASQTLDASNYTLYSDEPAFLWAENWWSVLSLSSTNPLPITLTYTTGYDSFNKIPRSTLQAIKVMCYHHFVNRGYENHPIPLSYRHHADQALLNNRRVEEYL